MTKLTKHASFNLLKEAANSTVTPVADKEKLSAEAEQMAVIISKLRAQRQQGNARKQ